jgi:hypothetical protein
MPSSMLIARVVGLLQRPAIPPRAKGRDPFPSQSICGARHNALAAWPPQTACAVPQRPFPAHQVGTWWELKDREGPGKIVKDPTLTPPHQAAELRK